MSELDLLQVPTHELERLASLLRERSAPIDGAFLSQHGLQHQQEKLRPLLVLEPSTTRLLLDAVLAERRRRRPEIELVWTGPANAASTARSTRVVLEDLFDSAQRHVLLAGYAFDHGEKILEPLHRGMKERHVQVDLFLDLRETAPRGADAEVFAQGRIERFLQDNWIFGEPRPQIYYDPRTTSIGQSLHAKCVVVDSEKALITSANFTDRGQTRNIETGVLVHDPGLAKKLVAQWRGLIAGRLVKQHRA